MIFYNQYYFVSRNEEIINPSVLRDDPIRHKQVLVEREIEWQSSAYPLFQILRLPQRQTNEMLVGSLSRPPLLFQAEEKDKLSLSFQKARNHLHWIYQGQFQTDCI